MNRMRRGRVRLAATGPRGEHSIWKDFSISSMENTLPAQLQRPPQSGWSNPELAAAIWLFESRAESDFAQSSDGSSRRSGVRRWSMSCFTECCTSSTPLAARLYHGLPSRNFEKKEKRFLEFESARRILDRLAA